MATYDIDAAREAFGDKSPGLGGGQSRFLGKRNSQASSSLAQGVRERERVGRTDIRGGQEIGTSGFVQGGRLSPESVERANAHIRARRATNNAPTEFNATNINTAFRSPVDTAPAPAPAPVAQVQAQVSTPVQAVAPAPVAQSLNNEPVQQQIPQGLAATNAPLNGRDPGPVAAPNPFVSQPRRRTQRNFFASGEGRTDGGFGFQGLQNYLAL